MVTWEIAVMTVISAINEADGPLASSACRCEQKKVSLKAQL